MLSHITKEKKQRLSLTSFSLYAIATLTVLVIIATEYLLDTRKVAAIAPKPRVADLPRNMADNSTSNCRTMLPPDMASSGKKTLLLNRTIQIVAYIPRHGMLKRDASKMPFSKCIFNNCLSFVSNNTSGADAIFIQGTSPTKPLPARDSYDQIIIFASIETPLYISYINTNNPFWDNFYNWSMTYRRDSDIPYMYGYVYPKYLSKQTVFTQLQTDNAVNERLYVDYESEVFENPLGIETKNYSHIFRQKHRTAAWIVSHCSTASKRENYVKIMNKTIDIDIFGKCSKRNCPKGNYSACDAKLVKTTFFYLAFENSVCTDYITEKAFKWFKADIVIVTRGARNYGNHLPRGTYIDADDFRNPTELASFLKRLSENEKEYTRYLMRKDMYEVFHRRTMAQIAFCNLCRKLNNLHIYGKSFDMQTAWSKGSCIGRKQINV